MDTHRLVLEKKFLLPLGVKMSSDGGVLSCTPYCYCINCNSLRTGQLVQFCVKTKSEDINQDLQTLPIPVCGSFGSQIVKRNVHLATSA